ncbi:translation initiation factor IF-3 [Spirosoma sp. KUDC1026]|uniref:translation initiation factor IF-3 n=1 Tax=Spirosoma sp. KUDC1026 TaxID=2745947 RepID=UPI00159BA472|nr:translation initiation factor IF-3 [Spirosoma sp. KUDC1026]QKZ13994.1 translation initiation factor IF-3 [Spirosoma sp. KUDC1026]
MALPQRRPPRRVVEEPYKVNERILAREVRVVGENVEQGIYDINKAQAMARAQNLDLVEVSPNAVPPVCRIVDYSKFKYEQKKKQKEIKANATKVVIKEIRFGPNTDDHDFEFKLKHAINFLKEGAKVKAYVQFVGRAIVFKDRGFQLLERFSKGLEEYGKIEAEPKLEGKRMTMFLAPKVVTVKK